METPTMNEDVSPVKPLVIFQLAMIVFGRVLTEKMDLNIPCDLDIKNCLRKSTMTPRSLHLYLKNARGWEEHFSSWWRLKYFVFLPLLGEMIQFDEHIFRWVETTIQFFAVSPAIMEVEDSALFGREVLKWPMFHFHDCGRKGNLHPKRHWSSMTLFGKKKGVFWRILNSLASCCWLWFISNLFFWTQLSPNKIYGNKNMTINLTHLVTS